MYELVKHELWKVRTNKTECTINNSIKMSVEVGESTPHVFYISNCFLPWNDTGFFSWQALFLTSRISKYTKPTKAASVQRRSTYIQTKTQVTFLDCTPLFAWSRECIIGHVSTCVAYEDKKRKIHVRFVPYVTMLPFVKLRLLEAYRCVTCAWNSTFRTVTK